MSQHHDDAKVHEPHALKEDNSTKGPHNPKEINPKMASDIAYWSQEFGVTGDQLHEPSAVTAPTSTRSAPPSTPTKSRSAAVFNSA